MRVAILYPGDQETRRNATPDNNRFADLFSAFANAGIHAEPAVYHDEFCEEVRQQLLHCDGVIVWINPITEGRDRSVLNAMLRDIAHAGIFVSTHPDIIRKLGTKEVLYHTRNVGWGCDTHLYTSLEQLREELPLRLATGMARVLKQYHGNGGDGVWRVQLPRDAIITDNAAVTSTTPDMNTVIFAHHAKRGCVEQRMTLQTFCQRCEEYFLVVNGRMIDQAYQERLAEGMIRCYLVHERVVGFGHQAINALYPAPPGAAPSDAPQPGPRHYHPPSKPEFQALKDKLEIEWVPAVQRLLDIDRESLPILWDCDFLLGPKDAKNEDTYILAEINVSSVAPYPESAVPYIVEASAARMQAARRIPGSEHSFC